MNKHRAFLGGNTSLVDKNRAYLSNKIRTTAKTKIAGTHETDGA